MVKPVGLGAREQITSRGIFLFNQSQALNGPFTLFPFKHFQFKSWYGNIALVIDKKSDPPKVATRLKKMGS